MGIFSSDEQDWDGDDVVTTPLTPEQKLQQVYERMIGQFFVELKTHMDKFLEKQRAQRVSDIATSRAQQALKKNKYPYRLENRYQDGGWEDIGMYYDTFEKANHAAMEKSKDGIHYGMLRVMKDDCELVVYSAGSGGR